LPKGRNHLTGRLAIRVTFQNHVLVRTGSAPLCDEKWKNRNVDTQAYFEHIEDIVREIAIKWPRGQWGDPAFMVKIQQDGARPHTSGKFKELWENLLVGLYLEGVLPSVDKIVLKTQPTQSPDTNLNDNSFFNALQAGYKRHAPRNARETIQAIFKVWREYPHERINHMWLTLQTNFDEISKCHCWKELSQGASVLTLGRSPGYPGLLVGSQAGVPTKELA
jgi:hypothetical protein